MVATRKSSKRAKRQRHDPLSGLFLMRYVEAYCEWLRVKSYSRVTAVGSRTALRIFVAWAHERGITDPREVTKPILERYQRHLYYYRKADGEPLKLGSQITMLRVVRRFFKWLTRENHILYNPASELDVPRQPHRLPRHLLSIAEVEAILNATDTETIQGLRDRALLELLYSTGLRRMEAANLSCYDVDVIERLVLVREGKGRRDRVVPLGERAVVWLEKYLLEARPQFAPLDSEALFVNDCGTAASGGFVAGRVRRYIEAAGINKPGAAHLLRHACATHMLEGGADIRFIQALLGHATMKTTEIYTHVSIEKLKAVHAAAHPAKLTHARSDESKEGKGEYQPTQEEAKQALLDALVSEDEEA